ncbi:MAG: tetratricopeptide repeat protein [Crocinitomicaceae bacterium]|nr:tetratricopeptide repeat protein [Crocinitomicaceae bacterium]
MRALLWLIILFAVGLPQNGIAKLENKDSLNQFILEHPDDSIGLQARLTYVQQIKHGYAESAPLIHEGISVSKKTHNHFFLQRFYHAAGIMYWQIGNSDSAIVDFQKALSYALYLKDTLSIGNANLGLANVYKNTGDYAKSVNHALESERYFNLAHDTTGAARSYNTLGLIFRQQKDADKAKFYYVQGLNLVRSMHDTVLESGFLSNIGVLYHELEYYDSAWIYHKSALNLRMAIGDRKAMAISYGNIGSLFLMQNNLDSALYYTNLALAEFSNVNYQMGMMEAYAALGDIWQKKDNHRNAILMFKKAEELANSGNFKPTLVSIARNMATSYQAIGDYRQAYQYLENFIAWRDSIFSDEETKKVQKLEIEFTYKKQQLEDSLKNAERERIAAYEMQKERDKNSAQQTKFRLFAVGGLAVLILILIIVIILSKSNRRQRQLNKIIAEQKTMVEEKNKEITDSINYARRIQEAILPPAQLIEKYLPDHFVLYLPKDIVAGDFYWLNADDNDVLIAAADCTGHGVPGAMVSVVCSNALNRAVKELKLKNPATILNKVRELVIETFEKSQHDVNDGMDIALVRIKKNEPTIKLEYAGANNPMWIYRAKEKSLIEIKPNNQPVGNFTKQTPFTSHEIELNKGDQVYIFTDGYADQFGGQDINRGGKKFKSANLFKLIQSIANSDMSYQKKTLHDTFIQWKGELEQLDDICIIGLKL